MFYLVSLNRAFPDLAYPELTFLSPKTIQPITQQANGSPDLFKLEWLNQDGHLKICQNKLLTLAMRLFCLPNKKYLTLPKFNTKIFILVAKNKNSFSPYQQLSQKNFCR